MLVHQLPLAVGERVVDLKHVLVFVSTGVLEVERSRRDHALLVTVTFVYQSLVR